LPEGERAVSSAKKSYKFKLAEWKALNKIEVIKGNKMFSNIKKEVIM
jgi:hypothetical protein